MRKSRYSDEQIAAALRQAEIGTPVAEITRKLGISEANWFRSLDDGRRHAAEWRRDYNANYPHSSLDNSSPDEFARRAKSHTQIAVNSGVPAV